MSDNDPTNSANDNERILRLLQQIDARLERLENRTDIIERKVDGIDQRLVVLENRIPPTNPLPGIALAVDELNRKVDRLIKDMRHIDLSFTHDHEKLIEMDVRIAKLEDDREKKH